ncbi:MAG: alpha amylase C-terminal domain-containing protein, partial [Mycobacteriaceae bacterium]
RDPIHRSYHHNQMTFSLLYAWSENFVLPISHDEVVHAKGTLWTRMPGNQYNKAAGLRALLAYMWAHPGKKLLFMGQEFGQHAEWSEEHGLDWPQLHNDFFSQGIQLLIQDLNRIYKSAPALWALDFTPGGYSWIDADDSKNNVLSFLRYGDEGSIIACVFNFSGSTYSNYQLGLPHKGHWTEILNTNATSYGGSGQGNQGKVLATETPWHDRPASAQLLLPTNAAIWLAWNGHIG